MAEEDAEGGSILTSPLALLAGGIVVLVALAYALTSILPGFLASSSMPEPPSGLSAEAISGGIRLSWQHPSFAQEKYVIYKSTASGALGSKANEVPGSMNSYIDLQVSAGIAYYYTVHSVLGANEEKNTNQATAVYLAGGNSAVPSSVGLKISGGAAYVNLRGVALSVSAVNAEECRFKNENSEWSAWEAFSPTVQWQLTSGDGAKNVFVQCRNQAELESSQVAASTILDTAAPTINVLKSARISGSRKFNLTFIAQDSASPSLSCKGYINGLESGINAKPGVKTSVIFSGLATKNAVHVTCTDLAGNSAETPLYPFDVEPSLLQNGTRIKINGDMAEARGVAVDLSLFSQDAYECRLKNSGEDFISWEPYKTTRGWTLTYGNGHKVVYYQCRDLNGQFVGEAQDDIILIRQNDGSRGGGDSGSGGTVGGSGDTDSNPSDLSISINNGAVYTNSYDVSLSLFANNAQECRLSEGAYTGEWEHYATSRQWRFATSTQDGNHIIKYECRGSAIPGEGQAYPSAEDSIVYDASTPDAPTALSAVSIQAGGIELSWAGRFPLYGFGTLPSPVSKYNVYRRVHVDEGQLPISASSSITNAMADFAQLVQGAIFADYPGQGDYLDPYSYYKAGEASSLSWKDTKTINGVSYDYVVKAENQAGTESEESNTATATSDSVPPQITVFSPAHGTGYRNGEQVFLRFNAIDAIDNGAVCSYVISTSSSSDEPRESNLGGLPNGLLVERELEVFTRDDQVVENRLDLACSDAAGNSKAYPTIRFDMIPPAVLEQIKRNKDSSPQSPTNVNTAPTEATPVFT